MTIVSAHQTNYLPSKAFFDKMKQSHIFVLLDDVQYEPRGYTNRTKIVPDQWLTVPVKKHPVETLIKDIEISYDEDWKTKHVNALTNEYHKSPNWSMIEPFILRLYAHPWEKLIGINLAWIREICSILDIKTNTMFSSALELQSKGSDRMLEMCKKTGADQYLSGPSGKNYLDMESFEKAGIKIIFTEPQKPNSLSILDDIMRGKI